MRSRESSRRFRSGFRTSRYRARRRSASAFRSTALIGGASSSRRVSFSPSARSSSTRAICSRFHACHVSRAKSVECIPRYDARPLGEPMQHCFPVEPRRRENRRHFRTLRIAYPWDFAEVNPLGETSGGYPSALEWVTLAAQSFSSGRLERQRSRISAEVLCAIPKAHARTWSSQTRPITTRFLTLT